MHTRKRLTNHFSGQAAECGVRAQYSMDIQTPNRPFWLKAMIVLVFITTLTATLGFGTQEDAEGYVTKSIRVVIFVPLFVGLILNSLIARWISIAVYTIVSVGGIGAFAVTLNSSNASPFIYLVMGVIAALVIVVTIGFALSKNVRAYYTEMRRIRESAKESPKNV